MSLFLTCIFIIIIALFAFCIITTVCCFGVGWVCMHAGFIHMYTCECLRIFWTSSRYGPQNGLQVRKFPGKKTVGCVFVCIPYLPGSSTLDHSLVFVGISRRFLSTGQVSWRLMVLFICLSQARTPSSLQTSVKDNANSLPITRWHLPILNLCCLWPSPIG